MLDTRRIELSKKRLEKAHREYDGAILNKNSNYYEIANTRAYYAAFHAIRALLALDDVDFKKHGSVIGYFNKNYVNTGFVDHSFIETINRRYSSGFAFLSTNVFRRILELKLIQSSIFYWLIKQTGREYSAFCLLD